jgi:hypothetical protein
MDRRKIQTHTSEAGERLQQVQELIGREEVDDAKVRFPRGFIITAATRRSLLRFVNSNTVRNNIAYTLMLYDVYLWMLRRTDIGGTARDMLVKACLATLGAIAEVLLVDWFKGRMGKRQSFSSRTERLVQEGVIDGRLQGELNWVWEMRCRQHLYELGSEFDFYSVNDQRRAAKAVRQLVEQLASTA